MTHILRSTSIAGASFVIFTNPGGTGVLRMKVARTSPSGPYYYYHHDVRVWCSWR